MNLLLPIADNRAKRTRALVALGLTCALAGLTAVLWPGDAESAPARVVVLGRTDSAPPASCPGKTVNNVPVVSCRVEGNVSGFQAIAGGIPDPFVSPFDGKIVAWSITLSRPSRVDGDTTTNEVGFFNEFLGSPSQARIGVIRQIGESKPPRYKLLRQSPLVTLNPYFGSTPTFALEHPLTVLRDQIVILTVPTWAPMFAFNIDEGNTWRGSREEGNCVSREDIQTGNPQQGVGKTKTYGCYYADARLLYTATVVKAP